MPPTNVCLQIPFRTLRVHAATYAISGPNLNDCIIPEQTVNLLDQESGVHVNMHVML